VDLRGVSGTAADDVWLAGDAGSLLHFDGNSWQSVDAGSAVDFASVLALSERELWLAGDGGTLVRLEAR
jgi:photosystem II stability/assembly factor-like uncharacterized protein